MLRKLATTRRMRPCGPRGNPANDSGPAFFFFSFFFRRLVDDLCLFLLWLKQAKSVKANQHVGSVAKLTKNVTWMEEQAREYAEILGLDASKCTIYTCIEALPK